MVQSPYISMGGDEVNQPRYENDTETHQELTANGQTFEQASSTLRTKRFKI